MYLHSVNVSSQISSSAEPSAYMHLQGMDHRTLSDPYPFLIPQQTYEKLLYIGNTGVIF